MTDEHKDAIDNAWRIHGALGDWTGRADTKASFALTLEAAILAGVVTLTGPGHHLHGMHGELQLTLFWIGVAGLGSGALSAAQAVLPQIRRSDVGNEWANHFIYFGHVRRWKPDDLTTALKDRDILPMLSKQLIEMGKIAWRKHARVQRSMVLALIGVAALVAVYLIK